MKKFISLFLSLVLALSLMTAGFAASDKTETPDPAPTPVVTLSPIDPDGPVNPPAQPMDDPIDPCPGAFDN